MTPHDLTEHSSPDQFVEIDLEGNQFGTSAKLPGELPIHLEIFKARPDVGAIAHFHCHYPTSFSMSEHDLKPSYFLASIFRDGIPVHPDARLIKTEERGMEDNAKRTAIAASMGKFETLSEEEMAEIQPELMGDPGPIGRIWTLVEAEAGV